MAKNSDQRAGGYETENTGGVLSGLLADEEHLDRRAMFQLGSWGVASVGAVIVAVLANQSGMKSRHDEVAALDLTRQSQQIQSVAKESQNETRRLASAIDTLNGDRDRMYSRLTTLEQGLESATGAIAKQSATAAAPPVPPAAPASPPVAQTAAPEPVAQNTTPEPAPVIAPVTTIAAAMPPTEKSSTGKPRAEAKKLAPAAAAGAPPSPAAAPAAAATPAPSNSPAATSAMPLMASKSIMAPPDPAAGKLIEPEPPAKPVATTAEPARSAATAPTPTTPVQAPTPTSADGSTPAPGAAAPAPAADKVAAAEPAQPASPPLAVKRTEFGVDVGGANSVGGLRALWRGLLKWRSNAALAALQPIIVVKEGNNGLGMQLRLVAGPLDDAAAAAKICASMTANDRHCETTVFDGQRLAMGTNDAPVMTESISAKPSSEKSSSNQSSSDNSAAKPASTGQSYHRRSYSYSKRTKPPEAAPAQKPETTSTLSWFSSRLRTQ
jgi:hypothetical protein